MFWIKNKENRYTPVPPPFYYIKLGFKRGVNFSWTWFPDDKVGRICNIYEADWAATVPRLW